MIRIPIVVWISAAISILSSFVGLNKQYRHSRYEVEVLTFTEGEPTQYIVYDRWVGDYVFLYMFQNPIVRRDIEQTVLDTENGETV